MNPITTRLAERLLGSPLIRNSIRGELVEEMVAVALEPEWRHCAGDWAAFDLKQADGPLGIQVKQSAVIKPRATPALDGQRLRLALFRIGHATNQLLLGRSTRNGGVDRGRSVCITRIGGICSRRSRIDSLLDSVFLAVSQLRHNPRF